MNYQEFIRKHGIKMTCEWAESNPNMGNEAWAKMANHWKCKIKMDRRQFSLYFSMGSALVGEPKLSNILISLMYDCDCANYDFNEFCSNLGYNNDSIKAFKDFKTIKRLSLKFARFMGHAMEDLLKCEE